MIKKSFFQSEKGCEEVFFAGESIAAEDFQKEAAFLLQEYEKSLSANGCSEESEFLLRFH